MLWDYSGPVPVPDTLTLLSRRPWYSMEYNDVVSALALQPWGMTDITSFLAGHQVGLKQYELTNHLGNVQATVSDYPYLRRVGEGDTIKLRNPALASAYDYYPFGMLMPDRYVSDTTGKCITISQPQWISSWTNNIYSAASWVWPGYTPMTGGGTTPASSAPVTPQQIVLYVTSTMPQIGISVMQQVNGQWVNLAATTAQAGLNTLTFTPAAAQVKLRFYRMDAAYTSKTMSIKTVNLQKRLLSQQTVLVDVCDEVNDKYRFGFNGQEKVNEWAGIGNHNTALFWEYDTRTGRRLNLDPKSNPSWSTYSAFGGNPILYSDPLGDTLRFKGYKNPKLSKNSFAAAKKTWEQMNQYLKENGLGAEVEELENSPNVYDVYFLTGEAMPNHGTGRDRKGNPIPGIVPSLNANPNYGLKAHNGYVMSPIEVLYHELGHMYLEDMIQRGKITLSTLQKEIGDPGSYGNIHDKWVIMKMDQKAGLKIGNEYTRFKVTRTDHGGWYQYSKSWKPAYAPEATIDQNEPREESGSSSQQDVKLNMGGGNNDDRGIK